MKKTIITLVLLLSVVYTTYTQEFKILDLKEKYHTHQTNDVKLNFVDSDGLYKIELLNDLDSILYTIKYTKPTDDIIFTIPVFNKPAKNLHLKIWKHTGYSEINNEEIWNLLNPVDTNTFDVEYTFMSPKIELLTSVNYTRPYTIKITGWDNPNISPILNIKQTGIIDSIEYQKQMEETLNINLYKFILEFNSNYISFSLKFQDIIFSDTNNIKVGYNKIEESINDKNLEIDSLKNELCNYILINDSLVIKINELLLEKKDTILYFKVIDDNLDTNYTVNVDEINYFVGEQINTNSKIFLFDVNGKAIDNYIIPENVIEYKTNNYFITKEELINNFKNINKNLKNGLYILCVFDGKVTQYFKIII